MPRKAPVIAAASAALATARSRGKAPATKKVVATEPHCERNGHVPVEVPPCPICCEPRDATDMEFYPCICGYQLCLFCYKRLKNEFTGQCPGCRAPYTADPEDCKRIIQSRAPETSKGGTAHGIPASFKQQQQRDSSYSHLYTAPEGLKVQPPPPPPPKLDAPGHSKPPELSHMRQDSPFTQHCADSFSLPSGTTWATPHLSRVPTQDFEVSAEAAVDDTTWPSLSDSLPPQASTPVRQNSSQSTAGQDVQLSRKLSSTTISGSESQLHHENGSMPTGSISTISQQPSDSPGPCKFHTAQVTSMVSGIKRAVCVPLELPPNSSIEPVPEAAAVLPNVKAAVREGRMSSTDGAHQLVTILRQTERSNRPSLLQAGRLPPGFADPAYRPVQHSTVEQPQKTVLQEAKPGIHLQQTVRLGGTVVEFQSDRSTLHSPFQHTSTSYNSNNTLLNTSSAAVAASPSANLLAPAGDVGAFAGRSLWHSNGLTGLDLSNSLRSAVPFNVSAIWQASQDPREAGLTGSGLTRSGLTGVGSVQEHTKPPPPGFGHLVSNKPPGMGNGYHPPLSPGPEPPRQWLTAQSSFGSGSCANRYTPPGIGSVGSARPAAPPPYRPLDFQPCIKSDFPRAPGTKT